MSIEKVVLTGHNGKSVTLNDPEHRDVRGYKIDGQRPHKIEITTSSLISEKDLEFIFKNARFVIKPRHIDGLEINGMGLHEFMEAYRSGILQTD